MGFVDIRKNFLSDESAKDIDDYMHDETDYIKNVEKERLRLLKSLQEDDGSPPSDLKAAKLYKEILDSIKKDHLQTKRISSNEKNAKETNGVLALLLETRDRCLIKQNYDEEEEEEVSYDPNFGELDIPDFEGDERELSDELIQETYEEFTARVKKKNNL